ncbi:MAG: M1 family metallopeptidase [Bacteroidetes bacterium]|nr:M1 family metallopeptidase [Bacteroidota bacterium]
MNNKFISFCSACILVLLSGINLNANAQDKPLIYPFDASYEISDRPIELSHLDARLNIKPFDTLVTATALFNFKVLGKSIDSVMFSVPEIKISEVEINQNPAKFRIDGSTAIVYTPGELLWGSMNSISFSYSVKPTDGLYFIGWNDPNQLKRKQIWAHRPDHWLPYYPGIITVNMAITVDERYKVFNNGVRQKVTDNPDHTRTWYYAMGHPHPFFSTSLVIGDYDYLSLTTKEGLPIEQWYYPDWYDHVEPTYRYMPEMFSYFESEMGVKYPWELYREAPVIDYMYGAMETTTSTIFGDYLMVDPRGYLGRNYVNVNAHELAHQWFGNYISHLKGKDLWLTETFATYYAKKFEQHVFGEDYYQEVRNKELTETLEAATHDNYGVGHSQGGRNRWYPKGSLVLDMLREELGDDAFKASIKLYLESFPYQTAETSDFLQSIRKASGRSMEWFFEEWIYRGGEPEYSIRYENIINSSGNHETRVFVEQVHATNEITGLFNMPIDFEVHYKDGTIDYKTQRIKSKDEEAIIPNPLNKAIEFVLFDPGRKVIKKVNFERSYDELIAQALKSAGMIDRYDALLALKPLPLPIKKEGLLNCYKHETYSLTKGEIIAQLSGDGSAEVLSILGQALRDTNDKVRLAVLQNLKIVPVELKKDYERLLKDPAYLNVELALENLCNSFPDDRSRYLSVTKNENGWRGRNIRIKWLEIAIGSGQKNYLDELKKYTGPSYEFETRINSMNLLKRLNYLDDYSCGNMLEAITHWNYKIKNAAVDVLTYFYAQSKYRLLIDTVVSRQSFPNIKVEFEKIRKAGK